MDRTLSLARGLSEPLLRDITRGEFLDWAAQNIPEWVMLEFGAAMAGLVLVTVNPALRRHKLEFVLKQSRSAGLFVVEAFVRAAPGQKIRKNERVEYLRAQPWPEQVLRQRKVRAGWAALEWQAIAAARVAAPKESAPCTNASLYRSTAASCRNVP